MPNTIITSGVSAGTPIGTTDALLGAGQARPTNAKQAAQQFESLLLAQMLNSIHEEESTGLDGVEDSNGATAALQDMANQQFAQMLPQKGGVGLSRLVVEGLGQKDLKKMTSVEKNKV
jgi:Rod binding domain-containing protein